MIRTISITQIGAYTAVVQYELALLSRGQDRIRRNPAELPAAAKIGVPTHLDSLDPHVRAVHDLPWHS